ncbi:MAG: class I SAM-dependent methyltransferase [candidate division WOR-3 bacterium]|nr:MAG: class I SAM-dependent methyltransferase [candidate division WOR-3 bacterium]
MDEIIWATPLYEFLRQCNSTSLDRTVLDCGAGSHGDRPPPLLLFYQQGYVTYGIEIAEDGLANAHEFCIENDKPLNILRGDMRRIPFADRVFGFVYSYNAIFFMTKADIALSMREIERVLKTGGICFVNFLSVDDPDRRPFRGNGFAARLLGSKHFSRHRNDEADVYFKNFEILRKEKRLVDKLYEGKRIKQAYIDYIARKY